MSYPKTYTNSDTKKTFTVTKAAISTPFDGHRITAKETGIFLWSDPQWGSVDWEVKDGRFKLHTIQSHPEKGTGLGSLLMFLAAKEAGAAECEMMDILSAATSERDYYTHMGCGPDKSKLEGFDENEFSVEAWKQLVGSLPVVGKTAQVMFSSSKSVVKRWK